MTAVYIIIGILVLYLVLVAGPAYVGYRAVFGKKKDAIPFEKFDPKGTYYEPYVGEILQLIEVTDAIPRERIRLTAFDGIELCADLIRNGSRNVVVFVHGYRGDPRVNFCSQIDCFYGKGLDMLTVHLRGHLESGGDTCQLGLTEYIDLMQWVEYLTGEGYTGIVLYGISMGATTVGYAADKIVPGAVKGLVLESAYTNPYDQIARDCRRRHLPAFLIMPVINFLFRRKYKKDLRTGIDGTLADCRIPTLFVHCTGDPTVPFSDSEVNYAACGAEKELLKVPGNHHTLSFLAGGEAVRAQILGFIERHLEPDGAAGTTDAAATATADEAADGAAAATAAGEEAAAQQ